LSREISIFGDADAVTLAGRQHGGGRYRETVAGPPRSETPSTQGNSVRENREIPLVPAVGRAAKGRPMAAIRR
jgi:hypothetical protein